MHFFSQYRGLRRENYVLFFGRIVTNMGSMVWPMLTIRAFSIVTSSRVTS